MSGPGSRARPQLTPEEYASLVLKKVYQNGPGANPLRSRLYSRIPRTEGTESGVANGNTTHLSSSKNTLPLKRTNLSQTSPARPGARLARKEDVERSSLNTVNVRKQPPAEEVEEILEASRTGADQLNVASKYLPVPRPHGYSTSLPPVADARNRLAAEQVVVRTTKEAKPTAGKHGIRVGPVESFDKVNTKDPFVFIDFLKRNPDSLEFVYLSPVEATSSPKIGGGGELTAETYNPYNLEIIPHAEVDPNNYYTLSAAGATHFCDGEAEFTTLAQWERENRLFEHVRKISFFVKYRMWKSFSMWKRWVRSKKSMECRSVLDSNLFYLSEHLRDALMEVKHLCVDISDLRLYRIERRGRTYRLDRFMVLQDEQRDRVLDKIQEVFEQIMIRVRGACECALEHAGFGQEQVKQLAQQQTNQQMNMVADALSDGGSARHSVGDHQSTLSRQRTASSHISLKRGNTGQGLNAASAAAILAGNEAPKMTYTELSAKRAECRKLASYIRMADYLLVDALFNLVINSVRDLQVLLTPFDDLPGYLKEHAQTLFRRLGDDLDIVDVDDPTTGKAGASDPMHEVTILADGRQIRHRKKGDHSGGDDDVGDAWKEELPEQRPLFETEVLLQESGDFFEYAPNGQTFSSKLDELISSFVQTVADVPKLYAHEEFKPYTQPALAEKGREEALETVGPDVATMIQEDDTYQGIVSSIRDAVDRGFTRVDEYTDAFSTYRQMFLENAAQDIRGMERRELTMHFFEYQLTMHKSQREEIRNMFVLHNIGLFRVSALKLREYLMPSPDMCLTDLFGFLPDLARSVNDELLTESKAANSKISSSPATVDEFVDYLSFLEAVSNSMESLEQRFEFLNEIYKLLERERVTIPRSDYESYTMSTVPMMSTLKASLTFSREAREDNVSKFTKILEQNVEELKDEVHSINEKSEHQMLTSVESNVEEALDYINGLHTRLSELVDRAKEYCKFQEMFETGIATYEEMDEVQQQVNLKHKLWQSLKDWKQLTQDWMATEFEAIDAEGISNDVQRYAKIVFQLMKGMPDNNVCAHLKKLVEQFKLTLPVVMDLRNPNLKPRHWKKMEEAIGHSLKRSGEEIITLGTLIDLNVMDRKDEISSVAQEATQEAALEDMLKKIESLWYETEFTVLNHKEQKDVFILGSVEDITVSLEDAQVTISTLLGSRYVAPIKKQVEQWDQDLNIMSDTLDEWLTCQRQWLYLENIFSAPDIQRRLPGETKMFITVDKFFRDVMRRTSINPNVHRATTTHGLHEKFVTMNSVLEKIQKQLEEYLELKRRAFPRFYFLSNDDLLSILAQTKNPLAVQPHMMKCFDNIKSLDFGKNLVDINGMISSEGEYVTLGRNLKARGTVESWLKNVESYMYQTLQRLMRTGVQEYEKTPRKEFIFDHCMQVVLTVCQIFWTKSVTEALLNGDTDPNALKRVTEDHIANLNMNADLARTDLSKLQRAVVSTLITVDVHARDVLEAMLREGISRETDFGWMKQLRYYWDTQEDDCFLRQSNTSFRYGYEYLGCQGRLVITPLTDRIYMTLTGALHLFLGGAPAGPAGTGKTETTKDLAKAMGRQCIVFNCSEGVTYKMMGKFFSGLVQTGAMCCFDEFNRINIEVLSVIATQLLTIRNALLNWSDDSHLFMFEGREIPIKSSVGVFITMNPGYAGRTELPDNLKALFRPVACMIPDYRMIAEVILFSEGFKDAKTLSRKMTQLYKLSSEQLSSQDHYDFGMRAVKSVLVMAGQLKRLYSELPEDVTLIRAMRDSNVPKFLAEDVPLFQAILKDLFPDVTLPDEDLGVLEKALRSELKSRDMQFVDKQLKKILQLYETLNVRHGVMLVGPTGGGKTVARTVLQKSLTSIRKNIIPENPDAEHPSYQIVRSFVLNPKSISYAELYGAFNLTTHEWFDGIVPVIVRKCVSDSSPDRKWLIFDGPVDTLWIESMNSVLDDSKLLCLDSGERIKLNDTMSLLFEVQDLAVASPATVSRCGMVYYDPADLGWEPVVKSFIEVKLRRPAKLPEKGLEHLEKLFHSHLANLLSFVRKECDEPFQTVDVQLAQSVCDLFYAVLFEYFDGAEDKRRKLPEMESGILKLVGLAFYFSCTWSVGGAISTKSQNIFSDFCRSELDSVATMPGFGTIYDFYIDFDQLVFQRWDDVVPDFKYDESKPFHQLLVPTVDTVRYSYLLETLIRVRKPILYCGDTGVGKSVTISNHLQANGDKMAIDLVTVQFSARTSASRTQEMIESKLEKKRKTILGAPPGKAVVLFLDDLNMPEREKFGAQPPLELIRQLLGSGGFYDREKLFFKEVTGVTTVAACGPPGGGRNPVSQRLLRFFHVLSVPKLSQKNMEKICTSLLEGFLHPFTSDVRGLTRAAVQSSVEIYQKICEELLPTPARSHYVFNFRDLMKVIQGVCQVQPRSVPNGQVFTRLWVHEMLRCFHDRLIDQGDRKYFCNLIMESLKRQFMSSWSFEEVFPEEPDKLPIVFGDFLRMGIPAEDRMYEPANMDVAKMTKLLDDYLDEYNLNNAKHMNLVFFRDAMGHVARLCRTLRMPRGNLLLVGVGGSGKQSLTRLAAAMCDYECFQIELTRSYGSNEFHEDLKKMYMTAGVEGKPVVFLLSDTQIVNESFLEDINNILNSGEVPNLFEDDERIRIINDIRPAAQAAEIVDTRDSLYSFFVDRVRSNLHIVICMSPVGDAFRTRCRQFPSLVNCCTIDWFDKWPREALLSVSSRFLEDADVGGDDVKEQIVQLFADVHVSVQKMAETFYEQLRRRFYVTPTSFLEFINAYLSMLTEKREEMHSSFSKLDGGLCKLNDANEQVNEMQKELHDLRPVLEQKSEENSKLLKKIEEDTVKAEEVRHKVSAEEEMVNEKTREAEEIAADAQRDLDEALPALEAAVKALDSLNKDDIIEIKSYSKPPALVMTVMEAVCILLGEKKPDWSVAKQYLGDGGFLRSLISFDKDHISEGSLKRLQKYIKDKQFVPEVVGNVSRAAESMCMWVRAIEVYSRVAKKVEPKRQRLRGAQEKLNELQKKLAEKQAELGEVEAQLASYNAALERNLQEKKLLEDKTHLCEKRLSAATKLTSALSEEAVRWRETAASIKDQMSFLPGDMFLAAALVVYTGPLTGHYRDELADMWLSQCTDRSIPCSERFSLKAALASPVQVRDWEIWGLPSDTVSVENGVMVTRSRRWPLMIDPQGQANRWVKNMEAKNGLKVVKLTESNYLRTLENSIRIGTPVLLEDIGEMLDPALEPILLKQIFKIQGRTLIRIGDQDVDYDPNFRFYMTTKLANPHYLPDICIKVALVNFTVTERGLEDQLLGDVVRKERPELEEQKDRLVVSLAADKKQLKDIEDKILKLLSQSTGNILDDVVLINTLNDSKVTSGVIEERVKEAEVTEHSINEAREQYRPMAIRGSIIYFVIAQMAMIDPMYQYSLEYFKKLFNMCIDQTEPCEDLDDRLEALINGLTAFVYRNVTRGLFEKDKVLFSFMITCQVLRKAGKISEEEWALFLRGGAMVDRTKIDLKKPSWDWLTERIWDSVAALEQNVTAFEGLMAHILENRDSWASFVEATDPHRDPLPTSKWSQEGAITPFEHLLLLKALRPEKLMFLAMDYVEQMLGTEFIQSPPFDLDKALEDAQPSTPIIFILSQGADPTAALLRFAKEKKNYTDRMRVLSLGQGQGPIAKRMVEQAQNSGDWVLLQNCHLGTSFMTELEQLVLRMQQPHVDLHEDFRLWLTSMPCGEFPIPVLQNGVKLTNEPPKGLRANLLRSLDQVTPEQFTEFDECEESFPTCSKSHAFKKLLFGLCFFHAIIQERKKFGPLGWNVKYEFNDSDLEFSKSWLRLLVLQQPSISWDALRYMIGEINYGGRVTDFWDRRCIASILARYYQEDVMNEGFSLADGDNMYHIPEADEKLAWVDYVKTLPMNDNPNVFGMHENANITFQQQESSRMLDTIVSIMPRVGAGGGGKSNEEVVTELAQSILAALPEELTVRDALQSNFAVDETSGVMNSLGTVLLHEMERFNKLLDVIRSSLTELQKALKGLVVLSAELDSVLEALLKNAVPDMWAAAAYPSMKPLAAWVKDLSQRVAFISSWLTDGTPKSFWMSGLFFPQGFLTGVLQTYARRHLIPIDTLEYTFDFLKVPVKEISHGPAEGVYIHGLYTDGCRWDFDRHCLTDARRGELYSEMPVVHFLPAAASELNDSAHGSGDNTYRSPLYKTAVRAGTLSTTGHSTNFVLAVDVPSEVEPNYWVLKGAALLCALPY